MTTALKPYRSVSQINQYIKCPQSYKLARIDKEWKRPAAWLSQGTAFHTVTEAFETRLIEGSPMTLEEAQELFKEEYSKDIGSLCDKTPNFEWWFWSGPYSGERDVERRYQIGLEQVAKFIGWRNTVGQTIWITPEGKPAIELRFDIDLDGIPVVGYIDAVVVVDGKLRVRDYKTGNSPGEDFQLGVYSVAVSEMFGVPAPETGDYFMAGKKGKPAKATYPYDLTHWTKEAVAAKFHEVEAKIQAGEFDPLPEPDKCGFCDVNYSCPVFGDRP